VSLRLEMLCDIMKSHALMAQLHADFQKRGVPYHPQIVAALNRVRVDLWVI
jgi:hypothetical protein